MRNFLKLTIKARFNFFLGIIIAVFVIIVAFFGFSISRIQQYNQYDKQIDELVIEYLTMRRFEQHFFLRHPDDPNFYKTGENKYILKHNDAYKDVERDIELLREKKLTQTLGLQMRVEKLKQFNKNYSKIFIDLSRKIFEKGSNETGIVGEMRLHFNEAYRMSRDPKISEYILLLRKHEKDYLIEQDIAYFNRFIEVFKELNDYINNNSFQSISLISDQDYISIDSSTLITITPEFVQHMNEYKRNFGRVIKLDKEIGLTHNLGLHGELRIEIHKFDPELELIQKTISTEKNKTITRTVQIMYIFVTIVIILLFIFILQFSNSITKPITRLKEYLQPLSKGILPTDLLPVSSKDEISEMIEAINELIIGLKKTTKFATTIGNGIFDTDFTPLSHDDTLGNSLLEMRENLSKSQQAENKRKLEDNLRKWANEGLTQFSKILSQRTSDIDELYNNVIKELVNFLQANQGGLFVYNDSHRTDIHLELVAAFAYNKEKKRVKKIYLGEGLVGTAAVEKETIYMTEVPNNYLNITSGLGGSNPRSILIVPLQLEDEIFGVIELASFQHFQQHEIEFVERVSENIASTLSIIKINSRTAMLLEKSQQQQEEMAAQEEEMRQNLEELQATQEESARRESEMKGLLNSINSSSIMIEYDLHGVIHTVNDEFTNQTHLEPEEVIGRNHREFAEMDLSEKAYEKFWKNLAMGQSKKEVTKYTFGEQDFWMSETYTPVFDERGEVYKILHIATDITQMKILENELLEQAEQMAAQEEEMRQNLEALQESQDRMANEQKKLEKANEKIKANENILKNAIDKLKNQERVLNEKNAQLSTSEEELRQNMEELIATQEQMRAQQEIMEHNNNRMQANEAILRKAIKKSQEEKKKHQDEILELNRKKEAFLEKVKQLEAENQRLIQLLDNKNN